METSGQAVPDGSSRAALVPVTTTTGGAAREPEGLPCPRCESVNTKFCYYNNYNLAQPRHFCKTCRRYWTRGGALRNVPVGGGTRKATLAAAGVRRKRAAASAAPASVPATASPTSALHGGGSLLRPYVGGGGVGGGMSFGAPAALPSPPLTAVDPAGRLLDFGGSFTSLIAPGAPDVGGVHFSAGFLLGGFAPAALPRAPASVAALPPSPPPPTQHQQQPTVSQALPEGVFWSIAGWPDLSI